jgi:hypothetical protein
VRQLCGLWNLANYETKLINMLTYIWTTALK